MNELGLGLPNSDQKLRLKTESPGSSQELAWCTSVRDLSHMVPSIMSINVLNMGLHDMVQDGGSSITPIL